MIQLAKNWRINNSNPPEVVLQQLRAKTSKKDPTQTHIWVNIAYCCTYSGVFNAYLMYHTAGASTIKELLKRIGEVQDLLKVTLTIPKTAQEIENGRGEFIEPDAKDRKRAEKKIKSNESKSVDK